MRFYSPGRVLSVLLLLVALTCATEGASFRARRSFFDDIGNAFNDIGETIKNTMRTGFKSVFKRPEDPEMMTSQPNETVNYRQIITAPVRCPPNHILVNKRCRLTTEG